MRVRRVLSLVTVSASLAWIAGAAAAPAGAQPALPKDFRSWKHVRSIAVSDPGHAMYGFHDGYANEAAVRGLRSGRNPLRFEDGATFVVSIYEIETEGGVTTAGPKRRDVLQVKDRRAAATGGWRFAAFDPDGKPVEVDEARCFSCHAHAKASDFVLTSYRE